ncbi:MAG TPA: hypothetical protein VF132_08210 [Rudaea sp.]
MTEFTDIELRDWLLHRLAEPRAAGLEERLFTDPHLADAIDGARYDLLDDCARGRLSPADARLVMQHLAAAPEDAWRLRISRALAHETAAPVVLAPRRTSRSDRNWVLGVGSAIAACVVVAFLTFGPRPPTSVRSDPSIEPAALPVVMLRDAQQRGDQPAVLALPHHAGDVRLQAEISAAVSPRSRYALRIADAHGVVFTAHDLAPRQAGPYRFVEAIVPANALGPDVRRVDLVEEGTSATGAATWSVQMNDSH